MACRLCWTSVNKLLPFEHLFPTTVIEFAEVVMRGDEHQILRQIEELTIGGSREMCSFEWTNLQAV